MPEGLVDSATISQVVQCLDRGTRGQYPWSLGTVLEFTALLMREGHLALAPGLTPPKGVIADDQDRLVDLLVSNGLVGFARRVGNDVKATAVTKSKQWVGRKENIAAVRAEVHRLVADERNFSHWIEWASTRAWVAHSRRMGGLADDTYLMYVAQILGRPLAEVEELQQQSKNAAELKHLSARRSSDFDLLVRAYVASAIIRGRYHEEVARHLGIQMIRHPLRGIITKTRTGPSPAVIDVPQSAWCLACIVLYGAVKQRRHSDRLQCWVSNVQKVRAAFSRGGLALADGTSHAAVDSAFSVARHAGVQLVDSKLDTLFEIVAGLGIGTLTSIFLSPWVGVPAGVAVRYGLKQAGFPGRIRNAIAFQTKEGLLKELSGGRIETAWS
jgi:hypothetical protein